MPRAPRARRQGGANRKEGHQESTRAQVPLAAVAPQVANAVVASVASESHTGPHPALEAWEANDQPIPASMQPAPLAAVPSAAVTDPETEQNQAMNQREEPTSALNLRYIFDREADVNGNGVFGTVYRAIDRYTQEQVALKCLHLDEEDCQDGIPSRVIREVSILRDFEHPNVVRLLDFIMDGLSDYALVFEYIDLDLHRYLRPYRNQQQKMPLHQVMMYAKDLFSGVHACHTRLIVHRDLKPQNVLVSPTGLKICDFGLARFFTLPQKPYTQTVVTLWYRAPEIILGAHFYGTEVDVWSSGCIITEMLTGLPTFPGDSEIGTVFKIFQLMGTPTPEIWPGVNTFDHWSDRFPMWPFSNLRPVLDARPDLAESGRVVMPLLNACLALNPSSRPSARLALNCLCNALAVPVLPAEA